MSRDSWILLVLTGNFSAKVICFIPYRFNTPEENLTECELMQFFGWLIPVFRSDQTKSHLVLSEKKSKALQKYQHVTSTHNTDQSKT